MGSDSFGYKLVLLLHLLFVVVGFGSSFVWPLVNRAAERVPGGSGYVVSTAARRASRLFTTVPIWLAGVLGFLLVALSDGVYGFDQTWITLASLLFFVAAIAATFLLAPANRQLDEARRLHASGEPRAAGLSAQLTKRVAIFSGLLHVAFALLMIVMVWKPGS